MADAVYNEGFETVYLGAVKADGSPDIANLLFQFPVPHRQMSVRQVSKIDEVKIPGRSGKQKQAVGYEDTEISIGITLVDREDKTGTVTYSAVQQFQELQAAFRDRSKPVATKTAVPGTAVANVPTVFAIKSRLTDACGIKTVVFKGLDVADVTGDTALDVSLTMVEFEPTTRPAEKRKKKKVSELDQYMADSAYYDALELADQESEFVGPVQGATPAQIAAAAADDAAANAAHDEEVGTEDPLAAAFRQGKSDAMGKSLGGLRM